MYCIMTSSTLTVSNVALEFGKTLVHPLSFIDEDTEMQGLRKLFQGHTMNFASSLKHFVWFSDPLLVSLSFIQCIFDKNN